MKLLHTAALTILLSGPALAQEVQHQRRVLHRPDRPVSWFNLLFSCYSTTSPRVPILTSLHYHGGLFVSSFLLFIAMLRRASCRASGSRWRKSTTGRKNYWRVWSSSDRRSLMITYPAVNWWRTRWDKICIVIIQSKVMQGIRVFWHWPLSCESSYALQELAKQQRHIKGLHRKLAAFKQKDPQVSSFCYILIILIYYYPWLCLLISHLVLLPFPNNISCWNSRLNKK